MKSNTFTSPLDAIASTSKSVAAVKLNTVASTSTSDAHILLPVGQLQTNSNVQKSTSSVSLLVSTETIPIAAGNSANAANGNSSSEYNHLYEIRIKIR